MTPYIIDRNFTNEDLVVTNNVRRFANIKQEKMEKNRDYTADNERLARFMGFAKNL